MKKCNVCGWNLINTAWYLYCVKCDAIVDGELSEPEQLQANSKKRLVTTQASERDTYPSKEVDTIAR